MSDIRDWIFAVGFCVVLSIVLVYLIILEITFSAVCVALTIVVFVYYYYYSTFIDQDEWIHLRSSGHRADAPTAYGAQYNLDDDDDHPSDGLEDGHDRPVGGSGRFSPTNSTVHNPRSFGPFAQGGLTQRMPCTAADSLSRRTFQTDRTDIINWNTNSNVSSHVYRIPSDSLSSISSSDVVCEQQENGSFSENNSVINNIRERSPLQPSEGHYSQSSSSSSSSSSSPILPKFRRLRHDFSTQEDLQGSRENDIYSHPTHQPQYGSLGILPSVHLLGAHHCLSKEHDSPSFNFNSASVKIAPPDQLRDSLVFLRQEEDISSAYSSDVSISSSMTTATEKRKRTVEGDEVGEMTSYALETLNKRRRANTEMLSSELSSEPMMHTCYRPNLKRPALKSTSDESVSPKFLRLSPPVSQPLNVQPGASARNAVEASYTSSRRWMDRMATPEVSISSRTSPSPIAGQSLQSEVRVHSKAWDIIDKAPPKSGQTERTEGKGRSSMEPVSRSSLRTSQPTSGRNTPVCSSASPKEGIADKRHVSYETSSQDDSLRADQSPSTKVNSSKEVASYKVHVTAEDIEKDREKELERIKHILGEDCPETENQQQTSSSFLSPPSFQCDVVASAGDVASVVANLSPTTAVSLAVSVSQAANLPVLCHYAVTGPSESSGSKLISVTSGNQPEPVRSLQMSVVSGASLNSAQFTVSSQPEAPLSSAGFDVGSGSAASPGGFQFGFPTLNKSPTSFEATNSTSGGFQLQSSVSPVASIATGSAAMKRDSAKGAALPGVNANSSSDRFPLDMTTKVPHAFINQPSSVTTAGISFSNAGRPATSPSGFSLQNSFSPNESSTFADVFPNAGVSGSNAGPTTSVIIRSNDQSSLAMNSNRTSAVDILNDITKSQALKNQNTSKTTSYPFTGALGFSASSTNPLLSSGNVSVLSTTTVNSMAVNSFMSPQISLHPFGGPTSTVTSSQATNLFSTNLFSNQTCSAGFFGHTSTASTFGNQSLGSSTTFASPPQTGFAFGNQIDQQNAFSSQAATGFPFKNSFASSNAPGQATQTGSFGGFSPNFSPANAVEPKSFGGQLLSSGSNSSLSSGQTATFPPNQNLVNANTGSNMPAASSQNPFSFGQPVNPFNFGQNSGPALSSVPNNSAATPPNLFSPMQNQFNFPSNPHSSIPHSSITPRFSIGADNSGATKSRTLLKGRLRKR